MPLVCIHSYLKSVLRHSIQFCILFIQKLYIYVIKDVRIDGYFSKTKGSAIKNVWEMLM